jgi:hypothetical protein
MWDYSMTEKELFVEALDLSLSGAKEMSDEDLNSNSNSITLEYKCEFYNNIYTYNIVSDTDKFYIQFTNSERKYVKLIIDTILNNPDKFYVKHMKAFLLHKDVKTIILKNADIIDKGFVTTTYMITFNKNLNNCILNRNRDCQIKNTNYVICFIIMQFILYLFYINYFVNI